MQPLLARREVVADTYFGITLEDPYRWMEDLHTEEMQEPHLAQWWPDRRDSSPARWYRYRSFMAGEISSCVG